MKRNDRQSPDREWPTYSNVKAQLRGSTWPMTVSKRKKKKLAKGFGKNSTGMETALAQKAKRKASRWTGRQRSRTPPQLVKGKAPSSKLVPATKVRSRRPPPPAKAVPSRVVSAKDDKAPNFADESFRDAVLDLDRPGAGSDFLSVSVVGDVVNASGYEKCEVAKVVDKSSGSGNKSVSVSFPQQKTAILPAQFWRQTRNAVRKSCKKHRTALLIGVSLTSFVAVALCVGMGVYEYTLLANKKAISIK